MRKKILTRGPEALADYEMLEMLLFLSMPKSDTKPLAKSLINRFGSFTAVLAASRRDLLATPGLGEHSVSVLLLVQGASLRMAKAEIIDCPLLNRWDLLLEYLNKVMSRERTEQFRVLFLDSKYRLLADEIQTRGTVNHTPVYPREVIKRGLELYATAMILVHNHPSGDPSPSIDDVEMTQAIKLVADVVGITLYDHVIVGNGRYFRFRTEGLLTR